ncbi:L-tryptophan--pyruvate aminotransferase 1-like [Actinidia eriantha]|uniref:L-tryptophan--pyruvate aminotransferase 1-like n=1 Tax=Actinidia eriantha TaxID=165200 RepID=UPI002590F807|nr:L-tryptophan--pyruvate aminotransferase 1-like [Actinidia eriantha]
MGGVEEQVAGFNKCALSSTPKENGTMKSLSSDAVINLDLGDPTLFQPYWSKVGDKCTITISGCQSLSYFANTKNLCWFLEQDLEEEIKRLHRVVGNAAVEDHHVVVGTGSTHLIHAALFALCSPDRSEPTSVVCAAPYYSCYPEATNFLQSGLYKWAGDAQTFDKDGPYLEIVTSPNNPDGTIREAVVKGGQGKLIHDLAYYWPQYTPITCCAHYDVMLFTASKCTGHAGSRIGWALVKDKDVARKMTKFIEVTTIGVSKEAQHRTAKILGVISDSCLHPGSNNFFEYGRRLMAERWEKLRVVMGRDELFTLPEYPQDYCLFTGEYSESHPGFAWMKSNENIEDFEKFLRGHKILARNGSRFGGDPKHVRASMLCPEEEFELFIERLLTIQGTSNGNHY